MGQLSQSFQPGDNDTLCACRRQAKVRLVVYDLLGHEVEILVDQSKPAGDHTVRFGADNLASGLYVYRLQAQGKTIVRTMMLVK